MSKAHELRAHLFKQFGGAGEDIQARQERFEAGMPKNAGGIAFPAGTDVVEKLRELEAERVALYTLCPASRRVNYEYGKKSTLVKIVLRHLRPTAYNDCIKALLSEIKMRLEFKASIPVWNDLTEKYETLPTAAQATEDWDYRNYHEDWLPEWEALKSKLVSVYKEKQFQTPGGKGSSSSLPSMYMYAGSEHQQQTPSMFMPGGGMNPKVRCFGCAVLMATGKETLDARLDLKTGTIAVLLNFWRRSRRVRRRGSMVCRIRRKVMEFAGLSETPESVSTDQHANSSTSVVVRHRRKRST